MNWIVVLFFVSGALIGSGVSIILAARTMHNECTECVHMIQEHKDDDDMEIDVLPEKKINFKAPCMLVNEYQRRAARTIRKDMHWKDQGKHALHGMVGEIGELHSIYQKKYQGHAFDETHAKKELGDLMWFIAEYCTAHGWTLGEICEMNIQKLEERYPDGFEEEKSLHRAEEDI